MEPIEKIDWMLPSFTLIAGMPNQGKTYFTRHLVDHLLKMKFDIYYVVNSAFEVEKDLAEQAIKHKRVFILRAKDLEGNTLNNIKKMLRENDNPKLLIFDNFTYQLSLPFLNFTTFARKYNASVVFITHTLFADAKIAPRLREAVNYFIFFYLPISNSYKRILDDELFEIYKDNIHSKSYMFLLLDLRNSGYIIDKIPHFKFDFEVIDQKQKGEVAKALKEMMEAEENKLADKDLLGRQLMGINENLIKQDFNLKMNKVKDKDAKNLLKQKQEKMLFQNKMRFDKSSLIEEIKQQDKVADFMAGMAKAQVKQSKSRKNR